MAGLITGVGGAHLTLEISQCFLRIGTKQYCNLKSSNTHFAQSELLMILQPNSALIDSIARVHHYCIICVRIVSWKG